MTLLPPLPLPQLSLRVFKHTERLEEQDSEHLNTATWMQLLAFWYLCLSPNRDFFMGAAFDP